MSSTFINKLGIWGKGAQEEARFRLIIKYNEKPLQNYLKENRNCQDE